MMSVKDKFLTLLEKYASKSENISIKQEDVNKDLDSFEDSLPSVEIKKSHDYEQKISVEIVAEPYTPDAHGHWYRPETIEKGFYSFDKRWRKGELPMNLYHGYDDSDSQFLELVKHYIVPFECEINGELVKEGTWCAEVKWKNDELWKQRTSVLEDGTTEIGGLSIKGWGKINSPQEIEKATTDDVTRDDKGNLVYRGTKFIGYNKPMRSNRDGKQGMVLAKKGDQIKVVHFGDPSLPDNQSVEQNDAYYARHGQEDDKFSARYWSNTWLWPRGSMKGKGAKDFYTLK